MKKLIFLSLLITNYSFAQTKTVEEQINKNLDNWHKAAAQANSDKFFDFMADDAIYIGTDKSERWDKSSFEKFAKPYFDKGKAWDFTPYNRQVIMSEDGKFVWFSELLDTWMGVCRGSGILTKIGDEWKLRQYHLSVTVPNEIINGFIELVNAYENEPEK